MLIADGLDVAQALGFGAAAWSAWQSWRAASPLEPPTDPAFPVGMALCAGSLDLFAVEVGVIGAALLRIGCTAGDDATITSMVSLTWLHVAGILAMAAIQATIASTTLTVAAVAFALLALVHARCARTLTATYRHTAHTGPDTPPGNSISTARPPEPQDRSQATSWRDLL